MTDGKKYRDIHICMHKIRARYACNRGHHCISDVYRGCDGNIKYSKVWWYLGL